MTDDDDLTERLEYLAGRIADARERERAAVERSNEPVSTAKDTDMNALLRRRASSRTYRLDDEDLAKKVNTDIRAAVGIVVNDTDDAA